MLPRYLHIHYLLRLEQVEPKDSPADRVGEDRFEQAGCLQIGRHSCHGHRVDVSLQLQEVQISFTMEQNSAGAVEHPGSSSIRSISCSCRRLDHL